MNDRIKEIRIELGYTQKEVAAYLKMEQTHYSRYERGIVKINCEMLAKLSKFYNISADYLLGTIDEKRPLK